jgi:hypothetical protein
LDTSTSGEAVGRDLETEAKKYRYIKTGGEDHFSLAFAYACMAAADEFLRGPVCRMLDIKRWLYATI